jgi:DNA mismatch repair protein MutS
LSELLLSEHIQEKIKNLNPRNASGLFPEQQKTPIIQQYETLKSNHPDCILCFQLGEFYEFFGLDALIVSDLCQLTLTARDKHKERPIPMAGVPVKHLSQSVSHLLSFDLSLAIAEQVETFGDESLVKRQVTSLMTPSLKGEEFEEENRLGIFLASLVPHEESFSVAFFQNTLNHISLSDNLTQSDLIYFLNHYQPSEILIPPRKKPELMALIQGSLTFQTRWLEGEIHSNLEAYFDQTHLRKLAERQNPSLNLCLEQLCQYLKKCFPQTQTFQLSLQHLQLEHHLKINDKALRHLEIFENHQGTSKGCAAPFLNKCVTKVGKKYFQENLRFPLQNLEKLKKRHLLIQECLQHPCSLQELRQFLKPCQGFRSYLARLTKTKARPQDLFAICDQYLNFQKFLGQLNAHPPLAEELKEVSQANQSCLESLLMINASLNRDAALCEQHWLKPDQHPAYLLLKKEEQEIEKTLNTILDQTKKETKIDQIKLIQNKQLDLFFEVSNTKASKLPSHYQLARSLLSRTRFTTKELRDIEWKFKKNQAELAEQSENILSDFQKILLLQQESLLRIDETVSQFDFVLTGALWLQEPGWSLPKFSSNPLTNLTNFFHPILKDRQCGSFTKNSLRLSPQTSSLGLLTGPNMAGKSTLMRQIGLIHLLAQIGFPVPAESAELGMVDQVLTRIGSGDDAHQGLSTFMVEMLESVYLLENATSKSLLLIDELGRGTSSKDGAAIAQALLENLSQKQIRTLFSTHYHHLQTLRDLNQQVLHMEVVESETAEQSQLQFTYKLKPGACSESYGIYVAKLSGMSEDLLRRAQELKEKEDVVTLEGAFSKTSHQPRREEDWQKELLSYNLKALSPQEGWDVLKKLQKKILKRQRLTSSSLTDFHESC